MDGVVAFTTGIGAGSVSTGASKKITGTAFYGIAAGSAGTGNITVTRATGDTIDSGSAGLNVFNQAGTIAQGVGSTITVNAYGTINSGTTDTGTGSQPPGILAGSQAGTTPTNNTTPSPTLPPTTPPTTIS